MTEHTTIISCNNVAVTIGQVAHSLWLIQGHEIHSIIKTFAEVTLLFARRKIWVRAALTPNLKRFPVIVLCEGRERKKHKWKEQPKHGC